MPAGLLEIPPDFDTFADALGRAVVVHELGIIVAVNKLAADMFGGEPGDFIGRSMFDHVAAESRVAVYVSMQRNDGKAYEFLGRRRDGGVFPVEGVGRECLFQGRPARIVSMRDISGRRPAQTTLGESVRFSDELIKNSPDAIAVVDLKGNFMALSLSNARMLGYERPEELVGRNVMEMFAPEDLERAKIRFPAIIREGGTQQIEYRFRRRDGRTFTGEISTAVIRDKQGNPRYLIGITRDVTEKKAEQAALKEALELYNAFVKASPDGVALIDLEGRFVIASPVMARFCEADKPEDLIGKSIFEVTSAGNLGLIKSIYKEMIKAPDFSFRHEIKKNMRDGSLLVADLSGAVVNDAQGRPMAMVGIMRDITERKKVEDDLKAAIELHNALIKAAPDAVGVVDLQGRFLVASEKMAEYFEVEKPETLIGKSIFDAVTSANVDKIREIFRAVMTGSEAIPKIEMQRIRKDGSLFIGELTGAPVKDASGRAWAGVGIMRDITERKRNEQALKESRDFVDTLIEMSPDAIVSTDLKGNLIRISRRTLELFGYDREEEILGRHISQLIHPDEIERQKERFKLYEKSTGRFFSTYTYLRKDGSSFIGEVSSVHVRDAAGNTSFIIGIIRDITERKKTMEALHESIELYQKLLKASPDAVVIIDLEGNVLDVSERFFPIFGLRGASVLIGRNIFDLIPEDKRQNVKAAMQKILKTGSAQNIEYAITKRDGSEVIVEVNVMLMRDAYGDPKAYIAVARDVTERKRSEQSLRESMEMREKLFKTSPDAIIVTDLETRIMEVNEQAMKTYGATDPSDMIGRSSFDFILPEDRARMIKSTRELLTEGSLSNVVYTLLKKDGSRIAAETSASLLRDANGNPRAVIAISRDITERKRSEQALHESMELYKKLVQASPEAVVVSSLEGKIVEASERTAVMRGVDSIDQIIGMGMFEVIAPEDRERAAQAAARTLREGFSGIMEYNMHRVDGSSFTGELSAALVRDSKGNPKAYIGTVRDITERKRAQAALIESEEKFRTLVNSMDDIIFALDREHRFVGLYGRPLQEYGQAWSQTLGKTVEEMLDATNIPVNPGGNIRTESFERTLRGESVSYNLSFEWQGETRYAMVSMSPMRNAEGEISGVVGVVRDVTALKRIEEYLAKADKLESLGIFAGGIAHDFNNILTAIIGNISLAKARVDKSVPMFKSLDEAEKAAIRAKDLTYQLLTFSKGGEPIRKTIPLAPLITDSCSFILRNSKSRLEFSIPDDLWPASVDEGQMNQVFHNLMLNADQAMPNGGVIKIRCENAIIPDHNELLLSPGRYVKISVEDQGIGIPEENLFKVFDPYFTTKRKGSGLGLTITYSIISKHDGRITVKSEEGVGTAIVIYLPASDQAVESLREPGELPLSGKGKILVMDDDEGIRRVASSLLKHMGFEVWLAEDGEEAVKHYVLARENGEPFDAVIMDLMVQQGMGGEEAVKRLHKIDPEAKVIVSSGYSTDPIMSDYRNHGFVGVITKPYGIDKLKEALQKVLPA